MDEEEIAPILERVDCTDENGNETVPIDDQTSDLPKTPTSQSRSPSKSPSKSLVKSLTTKSPIKKLFEQADEVDGGDSDGIDLPTVPLIVRESPTEVTIADAGESVVILDEDKSQLALTETGPSGDAAASLMPVLSPRKSPKAPNRAYRMVCQCGAKKCRKFVF